MVLPNDIDLLQPPAELEKRDHRLKCLVQSPNSFMDVKSQGCFNIMFYANQQVGKPSLPRDALSGERLIDLDFASRDAGI